MPNQGKTKRVPPAPGPAVPKKQAQKQVTKPAAVQAERKPAAGKGAVDYDLLHSLLGYALRRTQLAVFQHFARAMSAQAGDDRVSPGEFGVLALVEANPAINQTSLANAVGADRSTMVPIIDRLERRGLVERQAKPGDRRAHALRLTRSGTERMQRFRATVLEHEGKIGSGLSAAERQLLLDLLHRLRSASETV